MWVWDLDHEESWALKNWCFWTTVLKKTLESPLDCKKSNHSILKEISPECSLEGLILKLTLQYFGHLVWRTDSFEKTLMLGKIEARRRKGRQRMRWLDASPIWWTWGWASSGSWWLIGKPGMLQSMGSQLDMTEWLSWAVTWPLLDSESECFPILDVLVHSLFLVFHFLNE